MENVQHKQLLQSDFYCRGCHSPHSLDANGRCEFCRRERPEPVRFIVPWPLVAIFIIAVAVLAFGFCRAATA